MTVTTTTNKVTYAGNASSTVFTFTFPGVTASDLTVTTVIAGVTTIQPANTYSVSLNPPIAPNPTGIGGSITYPLIGPPLAVGSTITITRTLPLQQNTSFANQGTSYPTSIESQLDYLTMVLQQFANLEGLELAGPNTDPPGLNYILPSVAARANTGLAFDSSGNVIAGVLPSSGVISSAMQPVVSSTTLALGRTAFGLGTMAVEGIGAGLQDDGSGNARVDWITVSDATNQSVVAAFHMTQRVATGPITYTLPRSNTLWNGFGFFIYAFSAPITVTPNAADAFKGLASGTSITIQVGTAAFIATDGAASGTWLSFGTPSTLQPYFNVRFYGAVGNGVADDTAAIQAAITAAQAQATGGLVFFPAGTYKITTALSVTGLVNFAGSGPYTSILVPGTGISCLNISIPQNQAIFCKDFGIQYPSPSVASTVGIALSCSTGSAFTTGCLFDNLVITFADTSISITNGETFTIRACTLQKYGTNGGFGLFVTNPVNTDGGDFVVDGNTFVSIASLAILLRGVGGARIVNNKIFATGGGIAFQQPAATNSSLLIVTGNSIEAIGGANPFAVSMQRLGTTGQFVNVIVNDNEIEISAGIASARGVFIPTDANGVWVSNVNIASNIVTCETNSGSFAFADIDSTTTFSIIGNVGFFAGTALLSDTMVVTRTAADRGVVGPNVHSTGSAASAINSTNTTTIAPT